jgi:hypothetical protein
MDNLVVIGAGAAGLMAAIQAGKRGRSVAVLERSKKIGKKIRISGGGRCNFTNLYVSAGNFVSQNPHFCKSALAGFTPQDFVALVERHGIAYHEKSLGQLFCDKTSEEIIRLLEDECREANVEIKVNCVVQSVSKKGDVFEIETDQGILRSKSLVVASGGLSIPKMGATAFGYEIAKQFGLNVVSCKPGLVPLTWNGEDLGVYREITGVSLNAVVSYGGQSFREAILFTHRGLSGPAILQISNYWRPGNAILIDLLPEIEIMDELVEGRDEGKDLVTLLSKYLPRRFTQKWCAHNVPAKAMSHCSGKDLKAVSDKLHRWKVTPEGTEGYEKAEVTAGGVDTRELSSKTMESTKVPGLFFVGEAVDVTGHLGGFNFQWAWASGFAAGNAV